MIKSKDQEFQETKRQESLTSSKLTYADNESSEEKSNWFSFLCFSFLNPVFDKSATGTLDHKDLGGLCEYDRCDHLHNKFSTFWEEEKKLPASKRSLWRVLWRTCGYDKLFLGLVLYGIYQAEAFGPIEIMNRLVKYFQGTEHLTTTGKGILVALIFILPLTKAVFAAHSNAIFAHVGLQMRNSLITMIYRKSLRLSPTARQISSSGQILNLFSNDTQQVQRFMFCLNNTVVALPTIGVCLYLIYQQMNVATFVGLGFIFLLLPFNVLFFGILNMFRRNKVLITDVRVKLMNEILSGIRIIKYYAWEEAFSEKIIEVREGELKYLKLSAYVMAVLYTVLIQAVPVMLPILIFLTYIYLGNHLDPARAFTAIALFNLMQFPFVLLPMGLAQFSQASISCKRILEFLDADELEPYVIDKEGDDGVILEMNDATLGWSIESQGSVEPSLVPESMYTITEESLSPKSNGYQRLITEKESKGGKKEDEKLEIDVESNLAGIQMVEFRENDDNAEEEEKPLNRATKTLTEMNFQIHRGELVAVVGPVGSGKSSLLSALLGEMHLHSGSVRCAGSIAYCEQQAWILNETVRGNILFGKPLDGDKLEAALLAANLGDDLKSLSNGINTQIGERGINLSGGQKARIALARAVYQDADVYLLDDPLSAVDAHVGQFLFDNCMQGALSRKTRVLVTHHVHHLHRCDKIIILENGTIKFFGNYEQMKQSGVKLADTQNEDPIVEMSLPKDRVFIRNPETPQPPMPVSPLRRWTTERFRAFFTSVDESPRPRRDSSGRLNPSFGVPSIGGTPRPRRDSSGRTFEFPNFAESPRPRRDSSGRILVNPSFDVPNFGGSPRPRRDSSGRLNLGYGVPNIGGSPTRTVYNRNLNVSFDMPIFPGIPRKSTRRGPATTAMATDANATPRLNGMNASHSFSFMDMGRILFSHDVGDYEPLPMSRTIDEWDDPTSPNTQHTFQSVGLVASHDIIEGFSFSTSYKHTFNIREPILEVEEEANSKDNGNENNNTTLMTKEERKEGDVEWSVYQYYCGAGGWHWAIAFASFALIAQVLQLLGSYWLQWWGTVSVRRENEGRPLTEERNLYWLNIYIILGCGSIAAYGIRSAALSIHRIGVSELLQKDLLEKTMKSPISFFDTTPLGRILNRFSSDLSTVDEELTQTISSMMNCIVQVLGAVAGVVGATKGTFLIIFAPLGIFYLRLQKYFRLGNTNVARLESVSRSPVFADFSQALAGISSIRAYKDEQRFIEGVEKLVNANSIANITQQLFSQWLAIRLDLIGSFISFTIALVAVVAPGFLPAGFLAVGLSYSFQLTTYSRMFVLLSSQYEAQMNSVERIKHYVDTIPEEGLATELHETQIPVDWPSKGIIEAQNISMRYRAESPLVLKGISFRFDGQEKIGVTGRTGSGKSSLMVALFRMQELAEGRIFIDDLDISTVPLRMLRKRLGIIPQDPVMFSASIRFNLDPFEEYSDEDIWTALEAVSMKDHIMSLPRRLKEEVSEGGDNLSSGQRQLICIARAILRKPKILVLDEATASIDNETDALIQTMIRKQFSECTVLTIAHRLNTIIDYDRISVLDQGVLKELDAPRKLLENAGGIFRSLWEEHINSHGHS